MSVNARGVVIVTVLLLGCGQDGTPGPAGNVGATGPQGSAGMSGPKGDMGYPGDSGGPGNMGQMGATGDAGAPGMPGTPGDGGPPGPVGDAGPAGPRGGGVLWRDRLGAIVPVVTANFTGGYADLWIADARGLIWRASAGFGYNPGDLPPMPTTFFASGDCSGPGYVRTFEVIPRMVFRTSGDSELHVIPDNATIVPLAVGSSILSPSPCATTSGLQYALPLAGTVPTPTISAPAQGALLAAPAHPEFLP